MLLQAKIPSNYKFFPVHPSPHILQTIAFIQAISINVHLITVKMHSFSTARY